MATETEEFEANISCALYFKDLFRQWEKGLILPAPKWSNIYKMSTLYLLMFAKQVNKISQMYEDILISFTH